MLSTNGFPKAPTRSGLHAANLMALWACHGHRRLAVGALVVWLQSKGAEFNSAIQKDCGFAGLVELESHDAGAYEPRYVI